MLSRRKWGSATLLLVLLLCLSACDACPPPHTTLEIIGEESSNLQAMRDLQGEIEKAIDGKVKFHALPFGVAYEKATADLQSNSEPRYDVILQYNFALADYAGNKRILPIDAFPREAREALSMLEPEIFPELWREVSYYYRQKDNAEAGVQAFGYPFAGNSMLLVYNRAFFDDLRRKQLFRNKYGRDLAPPATWAEFERLAEFFTDQSKNEFGVALQGAEGSWLYYEWTNFLWGYGGRVYEKDFGWWEADPSHLRIDSAQSIEALEHYLALRNFNAGNFVNIDASAQQELLLNGNVAMAIVWSDYLYGLLEKAKSRKINFDFAPVPGEHSMLAGGSFYINRKTKNIELVGRFMAKILQPEFQRRLAERGLCSPIRSVYKDFENLPEYAPALLKSLDRGTYMLEAGRDADAVQRALTNTIQAAWLGRAEPRKALEDAKSEIIKFRNEVEN